MAGYRNLDGYPTYVGGKLETIVDLDGPASYNNTGVFATSGQVINASDFGWGGFEIVDAQSLSSDGLNWVQIQLPGQSQTGEAKGNAVPTARIHWLVQTTNAEVANAVNLSAKSIRLQIRGV